MLLVNKFHYRKGGSETYYFALSNALKSIGHSVIYFSMQDEKNLECKQSKYFVENVDYNKKQGVFEKIKNSLKLIYSFEAKKKFKKLVIKEKPDIVHLNLAHRQITLSIVDVCKKYKIPVVFTMHDLICVCPNYTMLSHLNVCEKCLNGNFTNCYKLSCVKNSKAKSLLATLEAYFYKFKRTYNKIDLYIAPSKFIQSKLKEGEFTSSPIIHLRNFLSNEVLYQMMPSNNKYILFFGRISKEKGIKTLINAYEKSSSKLLLYIVGDGPQAEELKNYVIDKKFYNKIKFLGFKTGNELDDLINNSHCVVLPSEWYENCPYTILEAMAKGKPVIGSRIGGIPELIEDGVTGFCYDAFNSDDLSEKIKKIENLCENEYNSLCFNSFEYAKANFAQDKYIEELINEYEKLLNKKGR